MDLRDFCSRSNVVIVIGKGGVGKTAITATLANVAARAGLDVLIASLDNSGHINRLFGNDEALSGTEMVLKTGTNEANGENSTIPGRIRAQLITPDAALSDYLSERGMGEVTRRLLEVGALDVVATAAPGVRELLILGRVKQLGKERHADLVVLDAPATGHALTLLTSPSGIADAARSGPLHDQAAQVVEFLSDGDRCQIFLVTIPEETPIGEVIETAYRLEDEIRVALGLVVVNACFPPLSHLDADPLTAAADTGVTLSESDAARINKAANFRKSRQSLQEEQCNRLTHELPLPQMRLPYVFSADVGEEELEVLTLAFEQAIKDRP